MGIKSIGGNTITTPLAKTNDAAQKTNFHDSTQDRANIRAIGFMLQQIAGKVDGLVEPQLQDDLPQEAQKLIEKHCYFGIHTIATLDSKSLGKELASTIETRPALAKAVFDELGSSGRAYAAQSMLEHLTDKQLSKIAASAEGKQVLGGIKESLTTNIEEENSWGRFFASKAEIAADKQRIQRIDTTLIEAAKTRQTKEVQGTQNNGNYHVVTEEQVKAIILPAAPKSKKAELEKNITDYTQRLNDTMKKFGVNTPLKQAAFLATMSEESSGLSTMTENPSKYGSSRLRTKGRGIIQLTGEGNYKAASERFDWGKFTIAKGKDGKERKVFTSWDLLDKPELAADPDRAFPIAGWFWSEQRAGKNFPTANECIGTTPDPTLNDFKDASYAVNGWNRKKNGIDPINWKARVENYERALKAFNLGDEKLFQNIKEIKSK